MDSTKKSIFTYFHNKRSSYARQKRFIYLFLILLFCSSFILHNFQHHIEHYASVPGHHHSWKCLIESFAGPAPHADPDDAVPVKGTVPSNPNHPHQDTDSDCPVCLVLHNNLLLLFLFTIYVIFLFRLCNIDRQTKTYFSTPKKFIREILTLTSLPRASL